MAIDQARVGAVAAKLMEILDQHDYGEDAEITDVMLLVAVDHDHGTSTRVHWSPSPGLSPHVGVGLLTYVRQALLSGLGER